MFPGLKMEQGLSLRAARPSDNGFLETLYRATRDDLRLIEGDDEMIEWLIDWQHDVQTTGIGDMFPNAMYFVIEVHGERVGRVVIDFGSNEIHVVDLAFIPMARGKGYGTQLLRALQRAAAAVRAPLTLVVLTNNPRAVQIYLNLGFRPEETTPMALRMAWYPNELQMHG